MNRKIILALFIFYPVVITRDITLRGEPHPAGNTTVFFSQRSNAYTPHSNSAPKPFWEKQKKTATIDTNDLKQSSWYAAVMKTIDEQEYVIKRNDKTGTFSTFNRQQQLNSSFSFDGMTLQPSDVVAKWKLNLQVSAVYANKNLFARPGEKDDAVIDSNNVLFTNEYFSTEYINSPEGIRQNFILRKKPNTGIDKIAIQLTTNKGWIINKVHDKELHFALSEGDHLSRKVTYNSLKAWDANKRELAASFVVNNNHTGFEIAVDAAGAVYPLTIDPLSTTAAAVVFSGQANAIMGRQVSSAGDVNGDGYSDVAVAAVGYNYGQPNTGAVFIYHGSATGISTTAAVMLYNVNCNQFGFAVSTAGDVNGDGYSDVIVGGPQYNNGSFTGGAAFVFYGSVSGVSNSGSTVLQGTTTWDLGHSVATAGDVNGDGYSDVIVGAPTYSSGANNGAAFIYLGSGTGISTTAISTVYGNQVNGYLGWSVASAGDVNGDGYSDVIVGAYNYNNGTAAEGAFFVYHGNASGINTTAATSVYGAQGTAQLGISVASAGDVNGDGYSDVIVGANGYTHTLSAEGAAFVYLGSSGGVSTSPATSLYSGQASARMGGCVASAGDVNGDGYSDIIVGARFYTNNGYTNEGAAFVYAGSATGINSTAIATLESSQSSAFFGWYVASAGDVNGDGYSDVIVGAAYYVTTQPLEGAAFVYHGSPDGLLANAANWSFESGQANANLGLHIASIASAGDINGDGYGDIVLGAPNYNNGLAGQGRVFVFYGSATGLPVSPNWTMDGSQAGASYGWTVASAGDVNGDGYSDVIIGAPNYNNGFANQGRAYLYNGSSTGLSVSASWTGEVSQASANFGFSVASAGDINGDGYSDVVVGVYNYTNVYAGEGAAYVYYGSATGLSATASWSYFSNQAGAHLGHTVASAGDVNGDGYSDVILGAHYYSSGPVQDGKAFLFYGSASGLPATPSWTAVGGLANAGFAVKVACAGDVNGDGYSDVIIGAHTYSPGGKVFVYLGSGSGLSATAAWTVVSSQATEYFGIVSSAGDVNGDGYSDVVIGAFNYSNGQSAEGRAYVYYGSATGLSLTPNWTYESNVAFAEFGYSVACAGDVNGDGFSDLLVGALGYTNGALTSEGKVFLFYGNANGGTRDNLRLYNTDLVTPIQQSNYHAPNLFGAGLFAKSPLGRVKGRLVWEVKQQGAGFSGNPITNSTAYYDRQTSFTDLGIAGIELKSNVQKMGMQTKVRVRVEYDKATAITGQLYGPWRYTPGYLQGAYGMNAIPLPVELNEFNGILRSGQVDLQWQNSHDLLVRSYHIERSADGIVFNEIGLVNGVQDNNSTYPYTDSHPFAGINYYRLRIMDVNGQLSYSTVIVINNTKHAVRVYPSLVKQGAAITIRFDATIPAGALLQIINSSGTVLYKKIIGIVRPGQEMSIALPRLAAGFYMVQILQANEKAGIGEFIVQ